MRTIRSEQQDYRPNLEKGEFAVGYFLGQTRLFIPKPIYERVGREKIERLREEIFSVEELEDYFTEGNLWSEWELSYSIELPPVDKIDIFPKTERDKEQKIPRLMALITQNIK